MTTRIVSIVTIMLTLAALALAGCAKPTVASQKARYQRVKDRLDAVSTKTPALRDGIQSKLAELDRDLAAAEAKGGPEAVTAMGAVVARAEAYEKQVTPTPTPAPAPPIDAGTPAPGSKLGGPPTTAAPGGKLGDPAAPAAGGKLGDPAAAGSGTSGFGGSAAPAPAPAPTPAPAAPASGFGGK